MAPVAPPAPRDRGGTGRLDMIAVVWGGLVASIGLMAALSFGLGGFLAGVRAAARRPMHAAAAWVAAYVIHACFIALAWVIDVVGGPDSPPLVAGGGRDWLIAALWALAFALLGGIVANMWLRPAGRR